MSETTKTHQEQQPVIDIIPIPNTVGCALTILALQYLDY